MPRLTLKLACLCALVTPSCVLDWAPDPGFDLPCHPDEAQCPSGYFCNADGFCVPDCDLVSDPGEITLSLTADGVLAGWTAIDNASGYQLEIIVNDGDPTFVDAPRGASEHLEISNTRDQTYRMRFQGTGVGCNTDWSEPVSITSSCGDGMVGPGEDCDDTGESVVCDQDCTPAECGDAYVNTIAGEECEDLNGRNDDACPDGPLGTCRAATCGDGHLWAADGGTETCDDGAQDTATCDYAGGIGPNACTAVACADGHPNAAAGEECDDGNFDTTDSCPDGTALQCRSARCGDGFVWGTGGETCDDGDGDNSDDCPDGVNGTCLDAVCGDGHVQVGVDQCDDGNSDPTDGCLSNCLNITDFAPTGLLTSAFQTDSSDDFVTDIRFGGGDVIVVWSGTDPSGGDTDIYRSVSTDGGVLWSIPAQLNTEPDDVPLDRSAEIAYAAGAWVAVWESEGATDLDIMWSRSTDGGQTWAPSAELLTYMATDTGFDADTSPRIVSAAGAAEPFIILWTTTYSPGSASPNIRGATASSTTATDRGIIHLDTRPGFNEAVAVAVGGTGSALAVWNYPSPTSGLPGTFDYDLIWASSADDGLSFTGGDALDANDAAVISSNNAAPQVAAVGAGAYIVVWESNDPLNGGGTDGDILFSRTEDSGASWSPPAFLNSTATSDAGANDERPAIASDGQDNVVVAWQSRYTFGGMLGTDLDIFVSRSLDAGLTWDNVVVLNSNAANDSNAVDSDVRVGTDGAGRWIVVWSSQFDQGGVTGPDIDILYSTAGF